MPTVRLREAAGYPDAAQKLFEPFKAGFQIADTLLPEPDMADIAPVDWSPTPRGARP